jgi:hypothetical protein
MGGDPWKKANLADQADALAITQLYTERGWWTVDELAETQGWAPHRVRTARWLATASGFLRVTSAQGGRATHYDDAATFAVTNKSASREPHAAA